MQDKSIENDNDLAEPGGNYHVEPQSKYVRYVHPLWDKYFKKIFASESSKEILRSFLNGVLEGVREVETVTYGKNEYPGELKSEGNAAFDVICTDTDGVTFLVEVQRHDQRYFKERSIYYAGRLMSDQAPVGKLWEYNLKDIYVICLLENFVLPGGEEGAYRRDVCLCDKTNGEIFYDKLDFIYLELKKFNKKQGELHTKLDEWLYALKHADRFNERPWFFKTPELVHFFELAQYSNLTPEEREMYRAQQKVWWDTQNTHDFAIEEAEKNGMARGLKKGMARGIKQGKELGRKEGKTEGVKEGIELGLKRGIEKGIKQGIKDGLKETVLKMKQNGIDLAVIVECTSLSKEQIEAL